MKGFREGLAGRGADYLRGCSGWLPPRQYSSSHDRDDQTCSDGANGRYPAESEPSDDEQTHRDGDETYPRQLPQTPQPREGGAPRPHREREVQAPTLDANDLQFPLCEEFPLCAARRIGRPSKRRERIAAGNKHGQRRTNAVVATLVATLFISDDIRAFGFDDERMLVTQYLSHFVIVQPGQEVIAPLVRTAPFSEDPFCVADQPVDDHPLQIGPVALVHGPDCSAVP